jgi:Fe-S-cluster containining protein
MTEPDDLPAGRFSSWVLRIQSANVEGEGVDVDVPCGECTACCTASYFIHIGPDEKATLSRIPRKLLFPAPGLPPGHVLMGYDERGCCPMLIDNQCSIYADRPATCRRYDCRIFPAAGLDPGGPEKAGVAERAERWRFSFPEKVDRDRHAAVKAAAAFLREHPECFPDRTVPSNSLQLAVLAIKAHYTFLASGREAEAEPRSPDVETVRAALRR